MPAHTLVSAQKQNDPLHPLWQVLSPLERRQNSPVQIPQDGSASLVLTVLTNSPVPRMPAVRKMNRIFRLINPLQ